MAPMDADEVLTARVVVSDTEKNHVTFDETEDWQELCRNCFHPIAATDGLCQCNIPAMDDFRLAMERERRKSNNAQDPPDQWVAVKKGNPFFFWPIFTIMSTSAFLLLAVFRQCVVHLNAAPDFEEWALYESQRWFLNIGAATIFIVWLHFRLDNLLMWYYRTRVAEAQT